MTWQQSIPLPTATSGSLPSTGNRYLTQGGTAAAEGGLSVTGDGKYVLLAGYNQIVGGVTNPGSSGTEDRVVGRLDLSAGSVDTTTAFQNFSGSTQGAAASRGAFSSNGTDIYLSSSTGVRYGTFGTNNASTGVSVGTANNARREVIYNNTLYQSENANSRSGIEYVGALGGPPPTTTGNAITLLPGFSSTLNTNQPYDFFFADSNTLYVCDDATQSSPAQDCRSGPLTRIRTNGCSSTTTPSPL